MARLLSSLWTSSLEQDEPFVVIHEQTKPSQRDIPEVFRMSEDLYEISADELQHLLSSGSLTSVDYTHVCLERIRKVCYSAAIHSNVLVPYLQ